MAEKSVENRVPEQSPAPRQSGRPIERPRLNPETTGVHRERPEDETERRRNRAEFLRGKNRARTIGNR